MLHGHGAEQRQVLESAADAQFGHAIARQASERAAIEEDAAALEVVQTGEAVEQRGLARAVGADQSYDLSSVHVEGNAIERDDPAKAHRDVADAQQRGRARRAPARQKLAAPLPRVTRLPLVSCASGVYACSEPGAAVCAGY